MSPDRLAALRRQRALVADHLAWLDAEIAASSTGQVASGVFPPPVFEADDVMESSPAGLADGAAPSIPTPTLPAPTAETPAIETANARADEILRTYAATERFNPEATRRGCFLFAIAILLFCITGVLAVYMIYYQ